MANTPTRNFRLNDADLELLEALAVHEGVSETGVIRIALRELARRRIAQSGGFGGVKLTKALGGHAVAVVEAKLAKPRGGK